MSKESEAIVRLLCSTMASNIDWKSGTGSADVMEGRTGFANHQSVGEKGKKASVQEGQGSSVVMVLQRADRENGQDGQGSATTAWSVHAGQDYNAEEA